jgi:hypothetical protein
MKLLRPVQRWIAQSTATEPDWIAGLSITQEDIDRELLYPVPVAKPNAQIPVAITWLGEELNA